MTSPAVSRQAVDCPSVATKPQRPPDGTGRVCHGQARIGAAASSTARRSRRRSSASASARRCCRRGPKRRERRGAGAALRGRSVLAEAAAQPLAARRRRSASGPTSRTMSGSSTAARRRCTTTRRAPSSTRRSPNAAAARRRCSSSTRPATWCAPGAARARATSGRSRTTASTSTTRATSGSAATARRTRTLLKFTKDGKFLMQVGGSGKNAGSNDPENFGRVAKIWVDPKTNEAYRRRRLLQQARRRARRRYRQDEALLGRLRQQAGRCQSRPLRPEGAPAQQFRNPVHCVERSNDGLVYVCDRANNRLQVFNPDGKFVKEAFYAKNTLASGSVWDIAFSQAIPSSATSSWPTARTRRCASSSATRWRS